MSSLKSWILCDAGQYTAAIANLRLSLTKSKESKLEWIALAIAVIRFAAVGGNSKLTPDEIINIKEYKKDIFDAIKQLPCINIYNKDELQNKILLNAYGKIGQAGDIFHAPRHRIGGFFIACDTDSGTLKDIRDELVKRGILVKRIENQTSIGVEEWDGIVDQMKDADEIELNSFTNSKN